jgi:hypothetical protein
MLNARKIAPPERKTANTTNIIIAMTTGLSGPDFLALAELAVGKVHWHEPKPRPTNAVLMSVSGIEFGHIAEVLTSACAWKILERQNADLAAAITELRKYLRPIDRRAYPRPREEDIKFWVDENGVEHHNIDILHQYDKLYGIIDPIRRRLNLPESVGFRDDADAAEKRDWFNDRLTTMNSIIMMSSIGMPPKQMRDAIPNIGDTKVARLVADAMKQSRIR